VEVFDDWLLTEILCFSLETGRCQDVNR